MFWWGCPCRRQFTKLCHYLPEVPSQTKANASMANPMQGKWVCDACYTRVPNPNWEPLQLKEFREMRAAFTLPRPMLPATALAGTTLVELVACSGAGVQSASARPGAVAPGVEGPPNLAPYTGQHVAGLCHQAVANQAARSRDQTLPFERACVQYRCVECSRSVDVAHNFGERTPQEHRTGDGSYAPCNGTLLPYAMPKLTHNAVDFSVLPPGVEPEAREQTFTSSSEMSFSFGLKPALVLGVAHVVEGTWLGAQLLAWSGPSMQSTRTYQVRVFKIGADLNTPSDGTQPTMPDKEQLRLEALRAARESWLQALRAAGLASRARQDAALVQASRQALLEDLQRAGKAMSLRQLRLALAASDRRKAECDARVAALLRPRLGHKKPADVEAELCEEAAGQQRSAQVGKRTEPAAGAEAHGRWPTPDPDRSTDATVSHQ